MAIYFNNLILEPKADGNSLQKRYHKELQEVKDLFKKFRKGEKESVLTFGREYRKVYNKRKTSFKPAPPIAIPMNTSLYDPELGSVEVRYSRRPPLRNGQTVTWQRDQESLIFEMLTVSENQLDLAWYLLKASPFVKNGIIKLIDKEVEYQGTFDKIKQQMEASAVIFGDDVTLENLMVIADLMFKGSIPTENVTQAELATRMWSLIEVNEKGKKANGFKDLLDTARKISGGMGTEATSEDIEVELANGEKLLVRALNCPPKITNEKLFAKAAELGLPVEGLSRNIIYSLIKAKDQK